MAYSELKYPIYRSQMLGFKDLVLLLAQSNTVVSRVKMTIFSYFCENSPLTQNAIDVQGFANHLLTCLLVHSGKRASEIKSKDVYKKRNDLSSCIHFNIILMTNTFLVSQQPNTRLKCFGSLTRVCHVFFRELCNYPRKV